MNVYLLKRLGHGPQITFIIIALDVSFINQKLLTRNLLRVYNLLLMQFLEKN